MLDFDQKRRIRDSLTAAIAKVYPFAVLLTIGQWEDRSTWTIQRDPAATTTQISAAANVIATFDVSDSAQSVRIKATARDIADAKLTEADDADPLWQAIKQQRDVIKRQRDRMTALLALLVQKGTITGQEVAAL